MRRILQGSALLLGLNGLLLLFAALVSRVVVPGWVKGPLIDPAAPYAPENAIVLSAVAACIVVDVYAVGLFSLRRRLGRRAWLPFVLLLVGLLAAEGGIRAWLAVDMVTYFRPHPTLHWQVRPDLRGFQNNADPSLITTNADGMREVEEPRRKPAGEFRLLVLGDSSNFGHGVEGDQMWSSVLEELLAARLPEGSLRVLNGACPGWTTYQALIFMEDTGLAYQPDLIIAGFNNDPGPDYLGDAQRLPDEPLRSINGLLWRSEVYLLARELVLSLVRRLHSVRSQRYSARQAGSEPIHGRLEDDTAARMVPRVSRDSFLDNLGRLQAMGQEQGFDFVWLNMPINRTMPELVERFVDPAYRSAAAERLVELEVPVVDVDARWRGVQGAPLHLQGHVFHPNVEGHRLLGLQVAQRLLEEELIPGAGGPEGLEGLAELEALGRLSFGCSSFTPVHAHVAAVLSEHPELLEEHDLRLQLRLYASGKTQGEAVASGALDAFFTCAVPAVFMLSGRPDTRVVASPGELGRVAVVARRDRARSLADLAGARVGLSEGSTSAMDWELWGQGLQTVDVPLQTDELEAALLEGRIDAVVSWDPWVEDWLQRSPRDLVVLAERPFWSQLALSLPWAESDPTGPARLAALLQRALELAAADREHYDAVVAERSGWPVSVVRAVADRNGLLKGRPGADIQVSEQSTAGLRRAWDWTGERRGPVEEVVYPQVLEGELPRLPEPHPRGRGGRPPPPPPRAP